MREPDIEAMITCSRNTAFFDGYRPAHLIKDDYLTTGTHHYFGRESIEPGESSLGSITFISPEVYPSCLWEGKKITIQEGSREVGYAIVTKVLNPLLKYMNSMQSGFTKT
jgi:GTPases - translation elongation factors